MKTKVIGGTILLVILGIFLLGKVNLKSDTPESSATPTPTPSVSENDPPTVISINPENETVIPPDSEIEIVFNRPLENEGELKVKFDPPAEFKRVLSPDRKTAKIIFEKPLELGTGYTLFITKDTKFTGVGAWGQEKDFHFQTIKFRGV